MSTGDPETSGITEDEVREYVEKLRSTPAQQIVVEMLFNAVNAAQVKLGRKDARLFIDLSALLVERLSAYLPDEAAAQVEQALGQLRLAQVQAEGEVAKAEEAEPNDLDRIPTGILPRGDTDPPSASPGSKLWVPGQDL
jgi:hypothetical protein